MMTLIGGHVSTAGGFLKAIKNAECIGAECIQIFGASPRQWHTRMPSQKEIEVYRRAIKKSSIRRVYLHGAYLVNLASIDGDKRKKSVKNLIEHFSIAELIGADGIIFHVGSGKGMSQQEALDLVIEGMKLVIKNVPGKSELIIENAAGGGQKLGANAKEIGEIISRIKSSRVKVCFDTAHAFEAGLIDEYSSTKIKSLLKDWDAEVGLENIVALHINDSKSPFYSHYDRHENIGKGYIGLNAFKNLAKEKRLFNKAWILEVPGFNGEGPDKKNIDIVRACFVKSNTR